MAKRKESLLVRTGSKSKLSDRIIAHFPAHRTFIEPFCGALGIFYRKPKAEFNLINDLDKDVWNLYNVVRFRKEEFIGALKTLVIHSELLQHWKKNQEEDDIWKAVRFLFLSNYTYLGLQSSLMMVPENLTTRLIGLLDDVQEYLLDVKFTCWDYKKFLKSLIFRRPEDKANSFIYADPPYVGTDSVYNNDGFTPEMTTELMETLVATGIRFAMSEFDNEHILAEAERLGLTVEFVIQRVNLMNTRNEIIIKNYTTQMSLF